VGDIHHLLFVQLRRNIIHCYVFTIVGVYREEREEAS